MHLGLICPNMTGHLNPMTTLGRALCRAGHRVTLVGTPDTRQKASDCGLEFLEIGAPEHASGEMETGRTRLGELRGLAAVRFTGQLLRKSAAVVLRDTPELVRSAGIEAFVVDQVTPAGSCVAQSLGLPFAIVCNALALNMEAAVPPVVMTWPNRRGWLARCRNRVGNRLLTLAAQPVFEAINSFRIAHGLKPYHPMDQSHGELIQVAQQPAFFDFPRDRLPEHFHFTGPWHERDRDRKINFPWERLDGRPVLFASLGTLQNRLQALFECIVEACSQEEVQLVLSLGRPEAKMELPTSSNAIIVPYAPQLELLQRAVAVVTHGGLNTALETLAQGLPMVAIPMTNDQPGVASRLKSLGVAQIVQPRSISVNRLRQAIQRILQDPRYRTSAKHYAQLLRSAPDVNSAAKLVSHALTHRVQLTRAEATKIHARGG